MRAVALVVAVMFLAGGCAARPILVRDVTIEGSVLVIEKCPLSETPNRCTTERRPLPRAAVRARTNAPMVSFAEARPALQYCAEQFHVSGIVKLGLLVDRSGRVVAVDPDEGDDDFAECARKACASLQFPVSARGTKLEVSFQVARPGDTPPTTRIAPVELPALLTDREILDGINPVRDAVSACGSKAVLDGLLSLRVTVSAAGRVASFHSPSADDALNSCLVAALKPARFPETREGGHATLSFRPPDMQPAATAVIEPRDPRTKELAIKAIERAKAGNCATAKAIGVAIRDADLRYYTRVFVVDPAIAACMH